MHPYSLLTMALAGMVERVHTLLQSCTSDVRASDCARVSPALPPVGTPAVQYRSRGPVVAFIRDGVKNVSSRAQTGIRAWNRHALPIYACVIEASVLPSP